MNLERVSGLQEDTSDYPRGQKKTNTYYRVRNYIKIHAAKAVFVASLGLGIDYVVSSAHEAATGERYFPYNFIDSYAQCDTAKERELPQTVKVTFYEEFPNPWRLSKLQLVNFPFDIAVAAHSRKEFLSLQKEIHDNYPFAREIYYWPLIPLDQGYYPGALSDHKIISRTLNESHGLPILLDSEFKPGGPDISVETIQNWWKNTEFIDQWIKDHPDQQIDVWRSHPTMGFHSPFLDLLGIHIDPNKYTNVSMHYNLYSDNDLSNGQKENILCNGISEYGPEKFVPALGVLDDGVDGGMFIPIDIFRHDLELARAAGVNRVAIFGVNGLNEEYVRAINETLPLETK